MALIRSAESIAKKWQQVTPARAHIYKANVEDPLRDWEKETLAASDRRDDGLRKAIADGRIDRGIKRVGKEGWKQPTTTVGPGRWSEGVALAEPKFLAGFAPFRDVIEKTNPGPRFATGDPRNWERSKRIGMAMHELKIKRT